MGRQDAGDDTFAPYCKFTPQRTFTHRGLRFKNPAPLLLVGIGFRQCFGSSVRYKKSRTVAFAIHRKAIGMSEPRIINPTTPLIPVWIQVGHYQMESLSHRLDSPKSSKAG